MPSVTPARACRRLLMSAVLVVTALASLVPVEVAAAPVTAGGFTTSATATPTDVPRGSAVSIAVSVTASSDRHALVDVEVYDGSGRKVFQRWWDAATFRSSRARTFTATWSVPTGQPRGPHTIKVGVFSTGWGTLYQWNDSAASFRVVSATTTTTTTTTAPSTTTTTTTTAPTTTVPGGGGRFETLPVGADLPSDATCASRVRGAAEIRPANATFNGTRGQRDPALPGFYGQVTGDFVGTTDEIIQWAACKWGFDEDVVRAQTAKESWWFQRNAGDFTSDPSRCVPGHPIGADGRPGQCPESIGVQQVRYPYWSWAFPYATDSTAYNLDAAMAARRNCFEGNETWLNQFDRGRDYVAGDLWGCVGLWFSGRWYTPESEAYIADVQDYLARRIWTTPEFINFTG